MQDIIHTHHPGRLLGRTIAILLLLVIGAIFQATAQYSYIQGWNMISQPKVVDDDTVAHIFPAAASQAYAYDTDAGYVTDDVFDKGTGYWLKFAAPETLFLIGLTMDSVDVPVVPGWNLVGSTTRALAVTDITSDTGGLITSRFFGFEQQYSATDSLRPGYGYWVKVTGAGILHFDPTPGPGATRIRIVPTDELPPAPPGGLYPNGPDGPPDQNDQADRSDQADQNGSENLAGSSAGTRTPDSYSLHGNYPNPFNPSTEIAYDLPSESKVRIVVVDMLGREQVVLVDGIQQAGRRSVTFDAAQLPSGVYLYRLEAVPVTGGRAGYTAIRKMVVMK